MEGNTAVTTRQTFGKIDSAPLFCVNAGVPIADALELAADLMAYIEALTAADALPKKAQAQALIQTLSEMAKALSKASSAGAHAAAS